MITSIQITIDLNSPYSAKIKLPQNELGGRTLYFTLTSSGVMVDLTDKFVVLSGQKPDGTVLFLPCVVTNATYGMVKCAVTSQFVAATGAITLQLRIYSPAFSAAATSATSISLYDTTQAFTPNLYSRKWIYIVSGTGAGQSRLIASNTATQIIVTEAWSINPTSGSVYAILTETANSFPFFAETIASLDIDTQVESSSDFSALQAAISTAAGMDASALHKTGDETKTGGLEITKGIFATGFDASALPAEKNGVAAYWNTTSPLGGVTGGCGRIAAFVKTAGPIVYKALGIGAYISGKFALLLNADGSAKFGGAVTLNANPTAALGAATKSYVDSYSPVGEIKIWPTATAPVGFLLCNGSLLSRSTFADLFAVLGTVYGAGDGSTTFALPNLLGKVVAGKSASGTFSTLGAAVGSETVALTESQNGPHYHAFSNNFIDGAQMNGTGNRQVACAGGGSTPAGAATSTAGAGSAHNNIQPTVVMNYIIRALA